ncbi:MAG: N-acetylmuramoyl-L-alanine amidase [Bryobacteraceae bacterium]
MAFASPSLSRVGSLIRVSGFLCLLGLTSPSEAQNRAASASLAVTDVRHWSLGEVTRIAIETDAEFTYVSDRLQNPDRFFVDIRGARVRVPGARRGISTIPVGDGLIKQIRIGENTTSVTRVVLDLSGPAEITSSQLANPHRLMIEVRRAGQGPVPLQAQTAPEPAASVPAAPSVPAPAAQAPAKPPAVGLPLAPDPIPPPGSEAARRAAARAKQTSAVRPAPAPVKAQPEAKQSAPLPQQPAQTVAQKDDPPPGPAPTPEPPAARAAIPEGGVPQPAKRGSRSLTRALGLKLGKVVLDPGHGGHDTGTIGASGLMEKELVLDIAKRLGTLIEERLGSEVVYTRTEDVFLSLDDRTRLANDSKADLFLSIHANSSPVRAVSGAETYYLNLTASKADLEVAARENAGHMKSIHELQDVLRQIATTEKREESREFATRVQQALHAACSEGNARARNRGVKPGPFMVLRGAKMPSVLTEVGFVSNPREENLLKRPEYRQKIAEALFEGVAQYASTLSHFAVAQRGEP